MSVRLNLVLVVNVALSYLNSIYTFRTLEVLRFDSKFVIKVPLIRNMFFSKYEDSSCFTAIS